MTTAVNLLSEKKDPKQFSKGILVMVEVGPERKLKSNFTT